MRNDKKKKNIFRGMAAFLLCRIPLEKYCDVRVREDMKELVAPLRVEEELRFYYEKRIALSLAIVGAGILLALLTTITQGQSGILKEAQGRLYIERDKADGMVKQAELVTEYQGEQAVLDLKIEPVKYTEEQFEAVCLEMQEKLPAMIKGENMDLEHVCKDLYLPERYGNYPFVLTWSFDNYDYIHTDGTADPKRLRELKEEGSVTQVEAVVTYDRYEMTLRFPLRFIKPEEESADLWEALQVFLEEEQDRQGTHKQFVLPDCFRKKEVRYAEKKNLSWIRIFFLSLVTSVVLFFAGNQDLHKETLRRREQLLRKYPEFVSKLMLFLGAGMTPKASFYQIYKDCEKTESTHAKQKDYFYEELKYMIHSLENGVSEIEAYEQFGKKCRVNQYRKLMALFVQNHKKGTANFIRLMEEEVRDNFERQKSEARRLGEKAGTKLLFPMIVMLGIVMVIIMVPAFISYQV